MRLIGLPIRLLTCLLLWPAGALAAGPADDFAWQQHPGASVDLHGPFRDETGRAVRLAELFGGTPVVLDLGYFHCPSLCGVVRSDVYAAVAAGGLVPGPDMKILAVSIDSAETPADAAHARAGDLAQAGSIDPSAVHYLVGGPAAVAALEATVGLRARWDAGLKQFMHPAGIVVLTRTGQVSAYLLGVGYSGGDLRAAVLRAGEGGIAQAALPILLLCFHFDSTTGRYTLAVEKVLRLLGGITVVVVVGLVVVLARRRRVGV